MMRDKFNLLSVLGLTIIISYLSLTQSPGGGSEGPGFLAIGFHLFAYFFLAGSLVLYFHNREIGYFGSVLIAGSFGLLMELGQTQIPTRVFSYNDLIINFLGASMIALDSKLGLENRIVDLEDRILRELNLSEEHF